MPSFKVFSPVNEFKYSALKKLFTYIFLLLFSCISLSAVAQLPGRLNNLRGMGGGGRSGGGGDSIKFEHRDPFLDSVSIRFKYIDSVGSYVFDSSLIDYYNRMPLKAEYLWLGNNGNAVSSLLFNPRMKPGWDAGFHAFDPYALTIEQTRFFNTTRPFTELDYQIGSGQEQFIQVLHTQNIKKNWNFAFQFRLLSAPGFFKSQNTTHSNLRFNTYYQSPNKRYGIYLIAFTNGLQSAENGGIKSDTFLTSKTGIYDTRFNIPVNLTQGADRSSDVFNTALKTGNKYNEFKFLVRQQYDFGKKDSLVTDSSVIKLFYPRFRIEHTIQYNTYKYLFQGLTPDSLFYATNYHLTGIESDSTIIYKNKWTEIVNDFSIYQFPDIRNQQQFLKVGASLQNLSFTGQGDTLKSNLYNIFLHGEYRNRTKNKKWDIEAYGQLYLTGLNAGDYSAYISLARVLGRRLGSLKLGFQNANKTPSYLLRNQTGFPVTTPAGGTNKENITHLFAVLQIPFLKMELSGHYYLINNYTYFKSFYEAEQQTSPFNVLQIKASKDFPISRHWHWYVDAVVQKTAGLSPVNLPLAYIRNRLVYQGRFFKNLVLATGIDSRYYTAYTPDNYSPITGQFVPQDSIRISNMPDIAAFLHIRIRSFTSFVRLENLNTVDFDGFKFIHNNMAAPLYPYQGLIFRLGIFWNFVN